MQISLYKGGFIGLALSNYQLSVALWKFVFSTALNIECTRGFSADFSRGYLLLRRRDAAFRTDATICIMHCQSFRQSYTMAAVAACRPSSFGMLVNAESVPAIDIAVASFAFAGSEGNCCENRSKGQREAGRRNKLLQVKYFLLFSRFEDVFAT